MTITKRGFSLVEVMFAILILIVGVSGVSHVLWWGKQNERSGPVLTDATNHARVLTETVVNRGVRAGGGVADWPQTGSGLYDDPATRSPLYDPIQGSIFVPHLSATDTSRFTRNVRAERLSDLNSTTGTHEEGLALVVVRVYWNEDGDAHERHVEMRALAEMR